jgi:hypothetical protein
MLLQEVVMSTTQTSTDVGAKHHWSEWNAAYIVARPHGKTVEEAAADGARRIERRV